MIFPGVKNVVFTACAVWLVFLSGNVWAGPPSGCEDDRISLTVLHEPLNYSLMMACGSSGGVTINPQTGARTATGCIDLSSGTPQRAQIKVVSNQRGQNANARLVRVTVSTASTSVTSGANSMGVDTFLLSPCNCTSTTQGGQQTQEYYIGATLGVAGNQAAGLYSGSFVVTAECDW